MVVGFTTTCAISAYHHWSCEFEFRLGKVYSIHYAIKFVSDLSQVGGLLTVFSTNTSDYHDITELLLKVALKHRNPNP